MNFVVVRSNRSKDEVLVDIDRVWNTEKPPTLGLLADASVFYCVAPGDTSGERGEVEERIAFLLGNFAECDPLWTKNQLDFLRSEMDLAAFNSRDWIDYNATFQYLKARQDLREREFRRTTFNLFSGLGFGCGQPETHQFESKE